MDPVGRRRIKHSVTPWITLRGASTTDNILVAAGTYYPTGLQSRRDRDSSFLILRSGIKIYGGFPTGGGLRDLSTNTTVLSGNIGNPADSPQIKGCLFSGNIEANNLGCGAGIYNMNASSPVIINSIFSGKLCRKEWGSPL